MSKDLGSLKVAVILAFYNGNKYLDEQLKSIFSQTHKNIKIFIFDDKSKDGINKSIYAFNNKLNNRISIIKRPQNIGYAKNFLYGMRDIDEKFDFYAFSDQDDIWEKNKIEIALKACNDKNNNNAKLFCSRTSYYNSDCTRELGSSKIHKRAPVFQNALVQNIVGGNTILINKKSRDILCDTLFSDEYTAHDWWSYQIISGVDGELIFSNEKTVRYRQHKTNLVGLNTSIKEKWKRLNYFFSGEYKKWCDLNIKNLYLNKNVISKDNLKTLNYFSKARDSKNVFSKLRNFKKSGVFRQTYLENLILIFGLLLNKV